MAKDRTGSIPDVSEILGPFLARVSVERQPLLLALAERMAADRYRSWATMATDDATREGLLACASREEEIAGRIEALEPEASTIQREIRSAVPEIDEINRSVFADRPVTEQYAIQAQGERLGAATWRSFAVRADSEAVRRTLLVCATLEEQSAAFVESILTDSATST